jgi:hypothetical protein
VATKGHNTETWFETILWLSQTLFPFQLLLSIINKEHVTLSLVLLYAKVAVENTNEAYLYLGLPIYVMVGNDDNNVLFYIILYYTTPSVLKYRIF